MLLAKLHCKKDEEGRLLAVMDVEDIWKPNKEQEARECYGTVELSHPAVSYLNARYFTALV